MASSVLRVVSPPPATAVNAALQQAFRSWAALPSGPLGWLSTHTVLNASTVVFRNVGDVCRLGVDDEVLDIACGGGGFLASQAGHVRRVAGIELSGLQVDLARRALAERIAAGAAEVVHGDAAALPWPEASFTVVTGTQFFEAIPEPEVVLAEVFRVLRQGGRAVLNIGQRVAPGTTTHQAWGGIWVWSEQDVRRMVDEAGFTNVSIQYVPWGEPNLVNKLFAKVVGPLGGDLRLVLGTKPER